MASGCAGEVYRTDDRKKFFPERVVRQWNRLPREVVKVALPFLEEFKSQVNVALENGV